MQAQLYCSDDHYFIDYNYTVLCIYLTNTSIECKITYGAIMLLLSQKSCFAFEVYSN